MRQIFLITVIFSAWIISPIFAETKDNATNIALDAKVTTSYVSPWETLGAVNDGNEPANSADNSKGAYGNWADTSSYNTYNWIMYEWDDPMKVYNTEVYWWDDNAGIDQPTHAYVEYWDGSLWINAGDIGTIMNIYNSLDLNITTNKMKITMKSLAATGILEWKVWGIGCGPTKLSGFINVNEEGEKEIKSSNIIEGSSVNLSIEPSASGSCIWSGPDEFTASGTELTLNDVQDNQSGTYIASYTNECGAKSKVFFELTISETFDGDLYEWPSYNPVLNYNFRDEFPELEMPTKDLDDCDGVIGTISDRWWTFKWGADANPLVTENAVNPLLERMNADFAYFRDTLGWPPDKRAKNGYRSAIYLFGSGLCTDNASNTDRGGWQSAVFYNGERWPMVLLSYYPVYSFDSSCTYSDRKFQKGGAVHEGIHSILADLPGCRNAAWFHEGGNTWLQQEADSRRSGDFSSVGFLNGGTLLAPFMPIECYSGWLQDDSFGGPSAEGVNKSENGQQICTWRNYLGGNQYGNSFPIFLGEIMSPGSVAWIWRNAESRVLEGMADALGDLQIRRLITEYRARQTLIDLGKWSDASRKVLNNYFGISIKAEWSPSWMNPPEWVGTPYAITTIDSTNLLTPEYRTTPGWSGANQIPLIIKGNKVTVNFQPIGENMTCQLCYRATDGTTVYGIPVTEGECSLKIEKEPANGVIFAVICNTDYLYEGESTRKAHFDYRVQIIEGVLQRGHPHVPWYNWDSRQVNRYTDTIEYPDTLENN